MYQFNNINNTIIMQEAEDLRSGLAEIITESPVDDIKAGHTRDKLLYIFTSGTTGLPKAAIITNLRYMLIPCGVYCALGLTREDVTYDPLPLYHTAGGVLGAGLSLVMGVTVVLKDKFSATVYFTDCAKYGCTVGQYIGEMCRYLLCTPSSDHDREHNLRLVIGNGLRAEVWNDFTSRFNIPRVVEFYGATESNTSLNDQFASQYFGNLLQQNNTPETADNETDYNENDLIGSANDESEEVNLDSKVGSIGFIPRAAGYVIYPLLLVRCNEITGEIYRDKKSRCIVCKPMEQGVLIGKINSKKAISAFAGYVDDSDANERKIIRHAFKVNEHYFNSGDILIMDHYGYFYFKDRLGDTYRWRGENVSTAEVESYIAKVVKLLDIMVYGVNVPHCEGKAGMLAITDPQGLVDLNKLLKSMKHLIPHYAIPVFVRITNVTEMTSTFKMRKFEMARQGFDVNLVKDDLYVLISNSYVRIDRELYDDINNGRIRL